MKTDAFEVPKIGKKMQKRGVLLSEKGGTTVKMNKAKSGSSWL